MFSATGYYKKSYRHIQQYNKRLTYSNDRKDDMYKQKINNNAKENNETGIQLSRISQGEMPALTFTMYINTSILHLRDMSWKPVARMKV